VRVQLLAQSAETKRGMHILQATAAFTYAYMANINTYTYTIDSG
jgi:hypothetical protein